MEKEKVISYSDNSFRFLNFSVLWKARTILLFLIRRDILATYKQSVLGILWAVIKPLAMSVIIVMVFQKMGKFPDYGFPYILLAITALSVWEFFSSTMFRGCMCLIEERKLITKVNFPRIILPFNAALKNTTGFIINIFMILILMIWYHIPFTINLLLIPVIYVIVVLINFSLGLWLSTTNVFFRDIDKTVPFIMRLGLFISPVGFTLQSVPEQWQALYCVNPLVCVIETMRFCVLGPQFLPDVSHYIISGASMVFLIVSGLFVFGKNERKFADVI